MLGRCLAGLDPSYCRVLHRDAEVVAVGVLGPEEVFVSARVHETVHENPIGGGRVEGAAVVEGGLDPVAGAAIGETGRGAAAAAEVFQQLLAGQVDRYDFIVEGPGGQNVGAGDLARRNGRPEAAEVADGDVGLRVGPQPGIEQQVVQRLTFGDPGGGVADDFSQRRFRFL